MKILKNNQEIFFNVKLANTFISRIVGLLGKESLGEFGGLMLSPCSQIHSFGMKFNFDAIYLDKNYKIIAVYERIEKNRIMPYNINAKYVLEVPCGEVNKKNLLIGDTLELAL